MIRVTSRSFIVEVMWMTVVTYFCRISSILLMYLGLLIGGFCTIFIVREFSRQSSLRTSLNLLIVTIFCTDCLRALICAPLEYVLRTVE